MSGATVRYKVDFEKPKRRKAAKVETMPAPERTPSRAAQSLALAYLVERLIDEGRLESYAEAARMLGVTRARMTQVMDLMNLPVELQEGILRGGCQHQAREACEAFRFERNVYRVKDRGGILG